MLQNQPHRTGPDLRRKLLHRIAHQAFFSGEKVSANPGAVQLTKGHDLRRPFFQASGRTSDPHQHGRVWMLGGRIPHEAYQDDDIWSGTNLGPNEQ